MNRTALYRKPAKIEQLSGRIFCSSFLWGTCAGLTSGLAAKGHPLPISLARRRSSCPSKAVPRGVDISPHLVLHPSDLVSERIEPKLACHFCKRCCAAILLRLVVALWNEVDLIQSDLLKTQGLGEFGPEQLTAAVPFLADAANPAFVFRCEVFGFWLSLCSNACVSSSEQGEIPSCIRHR